MALTVALVRYLMPHGARGSGAVGIASVYYHEDSGDSAGTKLEGSLINSLIFIGIIGAMTFVLFLMFKYRCTKVIYGYFGFAGFSIFAVLGGSVAVQVLLKANIAVDVISMGELEDNQAKLEEFVNAVNSSDRPLFAVMADTCSTTNRPSTPKRRRSTCRSLPATPPLHHARARRSSRRA